MRKSLQVPHQYLVFQGQSCTQAPSRRFLVLFIHVLFPLLPVGHSSPPRILWGPLAPQHKTTRTVPVSAVCPRPAGPTSSSIFSLPQPFRSPLINALPSHSMVRQTQTIHDFLLFLSVPQTQHPSSTSLLKPLVSSTQEDNHNQLPIRTTTCATQILISLCFAGPSPTSTRAPPW